MSLNLLAVQDDIATELRTLAQDVYETSAPDDSKLKFDVNGMILPYIVIEYSDLYPSISGNGILSSKYDIKASFIIVTCIGPTERSARQVANVVREKLTGYKPVDSGELVQAGGSVSYVSQDAKPNRYVAELAFTFLTNTVW